LITIIGNGESRKEIDIDKINGIKVGCNAIYLYNSVDLICAMDSFWRDKITKETDIPLLSRKYNNAFQTSLQLYNGSWEDTKCPFRGYCSGTTLLDYMLFIYKQPVYMIGFDFGYTGETVNHIYKGHRFHPRADKPAQNENIFLNQTIETAKRYPTLKIYWVNDSDFEIKIRNIEKIPIQQYKEVAYEMVKK
jgi:hypothetical protein